MSNSYDIYEAPFGLSGRLGSHPDVPNLTFIEFHPEPTPDPKSWEGRLLEEVAAAQRQLLAANGALEAVRAAISRADGTDVIAYLDNAKRCSRHAEFCMEEAARVAL